MDFTILKARQQGCTIFKSVVHEKIQNVFGRIVFHEHKRANVKIMKKIGITS